MLKPIIDAAESSPTLMQHDVLHQIVDQDPTGRALIDYHEEMDRGVLWDSYGLAEIFQPSDNTHKQIEDERFLPKQETCSETLGNPSEITLGDVKEPLILDNVEFPHIDDVDLPVFRKTTTTEYGPDNYSREITQCLIM